MPPETQSSRRILSEGRLPPEGAVRIEEFVNYFRFDYAAPHAVLAATWCS